MNYKNVKNFKKVENPDLERFKCGAKGTLYEDPNIEELYFCEECWNERFKTEKLEEYGYENEIPYED